MSRTSAALLPPKLPLAVSVPLLALLYFLTAHFSLKLAFAATNVSPVWPPSGLAVAALIILGVRAWPAITLGAFIANMVSFSSDAGVSAPMVMTSGAIAIGNTLEALAGAMLIKRLWAASEPFDRVANAFRFVVIAIGVCLISAAIGSLALMIGGFAPMSAMKTILLTWWLGDVAGVFMLTPLLLAWARPLRARPTAANAVSLVLLVVAVATVSFMVFSDWGRVDRVDRLLVFLYLPCIAYAAYSLGLRGVSLLVPSVVAIAVSATLAGVGPFIFGTVNASLIALDSFILLWVVCGLVLAADVSERRQDSDFQPRDLLLPWSAMIAALGLTAVVWYLTSLTVEENARRQFHSLTTTINARVEDRMRDYEQVLRGGAGLFNSSQNVTRDEWFRYVSDLELTESYPGIQGVGFATYLTSETEKEAFVSRVRAEGFENFELRPRGNRSAYIPVTYLEPFDWRNQRAHGYDMYSEAVRRRALAKARDTGETTLSEKITLVQETSVGTQAGFLMYLPIYYGGVVPETVAQRKDLMRGVVYSPFRMADLMGAILADSFSDVALEIFDGTDADPDKLLYQSTKQPALDTSSILSVPYEDFEPITVADRQWGVRIRSLPAFERAIDREKSQIVLVSGVLISLLLFSFVRMLVVTRARSQAHAKQMTTALRESEEKFATLAETAAEAIFIVDDQGHILSSNPAASKIFDYSQQEFRGMSWLKLVPTDDIKTRLDEFRNITQTQSRRTSWGRVIQSQCLRRDDEVFPVEFSISHWVANDHHFYGVILRDTTEAKRAAQTLETAREVAEAASRAKSEFVANMSHEIRTPMNAVLGMTQILARTSLSADQRNYLDMAHKAGQSLLEILNDILDFSKIEAGRMDIVPVTFDLDEVIRSLANIMAVEGANKDLKLAIGVEPDVPRRLVGDELRIRQVLVNLITNAIKFTEQGEVAMLIERVAEDGPNVTLRFRIRDTGIGMTEEQQERLFSAFTQADTSMTRRFGGTGLGLAISKQLLDLMGGTIDLRSEEYQGTEFIVELGLTLAQGRVTANNPVPDGGLRTLVVDGHDTSRDYIGMTFESWNWHFDTAVSADEALKLAQQASEAGEHYQLVLVGRAVLTTQPGLIDSIRGVGQDQRLIVILMIESHDQRHPVNVIDIGQADAVLVKPVTSSHLFDRLHEIIDLRQGGGMLDAAEAFDGLKGSLNRARLLLVEDNPLNQTVARQLLEYAGADVVLAENGQQAVDYLRQHSAEFDAVLMDVQMPVMDGLTATGIIRSELKLGLPILAMTAGVLESERQRCTEIGMNDFIAKPIVEGQMVSVIQQYLNAASEQPTLVGHEGADDDRDVLSTANLDRLLEVASANPAQAQVIMGIVRTMVERGPGPIIQARTDWQEGRPEDSVFALHKLRGSVGSLGALAFAEVAGKLEGRIRETPAAVSEAQWQDVETAFSKALAAMSQWLRFQNGQNQAAASADLEVNPQQLTQLRDWLAQQNMEAQTLYAEMKAALGEVLSASEMAALDEGMARLDYQMALQILASLERA
ncbi:CHASE domain-containing protein [Marinobacter caseinilyticus]|uniref:CHASE domain-containing protein n=1 Tax=Marinobacter caseinilyticus TaxID=2692195 RepID=UPI00140B11C3|nr:CHASE domain-containing protein [Marinobacter caseinilyticus]